MYLSGDVYGYQIENSEGDDVCLGCWGFYGDYETSDLLIEAKAEIDEEIEKRIEECLRDSKEQQEINHNVQPLEVY